MLDELFADKSAISLETAVKRTTFNKSAPVASAPKELTDEQKRMKSAIDALKSRGDVPEEIIKSMEEKFDLSEKSTTDPNVLLQPYEQPGDFTLEFPQPLDPTEIFTLCEEVSVYRALPEVRTPLNAHSWIEMTALDFATATEYDGFFSKGACPDRITASGESKTVTHKYIGAQQTLTDEDIRHSAAVSAMQGVGVNRLLQMDVITSLRNAKIKEARKLEIITVENWDLALVKGNSTVNTLAFDGIETQVTSANGARVNSNSTGTFDVEHFDYWLTAGCKKPTHLFGHPVALSNLKKAYLSMGATAGTAPVQQIVLSRGIDGGVVPGMVLADELFTSVGRLMLIPDMRFTATQVGADTFSSTIYALVMQHLGEPIVFKSVQTPLSFKDLAPGCTAVSFEIYAVTALVIKHMCAQAAYTARFEGVVGDPGCEIVAGTTIGDPRT